MPRRSAIPTQIRREIAIESGHRCAACGESCPLEFAHIIPWHRCKRHAPEDLIYLCANCHQRADSEHWGEKTLRDYKQTPFVQRRLSGKEKVEAKEAIILRIELQVDESRKREGKLLRLVITVDEESKIDLN